MPKEAKKHASKAFKLRSLILRGVSVQAGALAVDRGSPQEAGCGVRGIWVSLEARRQGVASKLLDTARLGALQFHMKTCMKTYSFLLSLASPSTSLACNVGAKAQHERTS